MRLRSSGAQSESSTCASGGDEDDGRSGKGWSSELTELFSSHEDVELNFNVLYPAHILMPRYPVACVCIHHWYRSFKLIRDWASRLVLIENFARAHNCNA